MSQACTPLPVADYNVIISILQAIASPITKSVETSTTQEVIRPQQSIASETVSSSQQTVAQPAAATPVTPVAQPPSLPSPTQVAENVTVKTEPGVTPQPARKPSGLTEEQVSV